MIYYLNFDIHHNFNGALLQTRFTMNLIKAYIGRGAPLTPLQQAIYNAMTETRDEEGKPSDGAIFTARDAYIELWCSTSEDHYQLGRHEATRVGRITTPHSTKIIKDTPIKVTARRTQTSRL